MTDIGAFMIDNNEFESAEEILLKSVDVIENSVGNDHYYMARARFELGRLYFETDQYEKAEYYVVKSLGYYVRWGGRMTNCTISGSALQLAGLNAYLSQLEKGKIQKPSPNVLHSLAAVYAVPYETLMEKAGYLLPSDGDKHGRRRRLAAFAIDDLTAEEEEELLKYLAFLRSRKPSS
jgi:transcriptional regulator with XRE-family HTH domain